MDQIRKPASRSSKITASRNECRVRSQIRQLWSAVCCYKAMDGDDSERGIAWRYADLLRIREFLGGLG